MTQIVGHTVTDLILARRSVREGFLGKPIAVEDLELIVRCGLSAPSSKNAQPWRLHVVGNNRPLRVIAEAVRGADGADNYVPHDPRTGIPYPRYVSTVAESAAVITEAAGAIFIENRGVFSGGRDQLARATPDALRASITGYGLELVGLGTAVENMWLAANALGLAAAFIGDVAVAEETIAQHLKLAGDLVGVLALGYARGAPVTPQPPRAEGLVVWH